MEAYLLPEIIKNKKTNDAVGALFNTVTSGVKNVLSFGKDPANKPNTNADAKAMPKPIKVLAIVIPIHL